MAVELPGRCVGLAGCKQPVLRMSRCLKHLREFEEKARTHNSIEDDDEVLPPVVVAPAPLLVPAVKRERADMAAHRKYAAQALTATKYLTMGEVQSHRRTAPRWIWLWDLLENMPTDKCALQVDLPADLEITRFANMIRTALSMQKRLNDNRWSVRKSQDDTCIIITKVGIWKEYDAERK